MRSLASYCARTEFVRAALQAGVRVAPHRFARRHGLTRQARQNSKMLQYSRCACFGPGIEARLHIRPASISVVFLLIADLSFIRPQNAAANRNSFSRRCLRPSFANYNEKFRILAVSRGEQSAERRIQPMSAQHRQGVAACDARARKRAADNLRQLAQLVCSRGALACRRSTCGSRRDCDIPAQLQAMLPGIWSKRALPVLSCPSPAKAPPASVVVPKRMMPRAAPARVANPRGSTALAPHTGSHPECAPLVSEIRCICN